MSRESRVVTNVRSAAVRWTVLGVLGVTSACEPAGVDWRGAPTRVALEIGGDETAEPMTMRLVIRPDGSPALEPAGTPVTSPAATDTAACGSSLRTARSSRAEVYGVWWSRRGDATAALVAARSEDGGATWTASVPVDTTDRWPVACSRPAPAIAADSASGYVHVTYFLHGVEGPGVFFSHSMERGELFHAPVAIVYGARPAETAIAASDSLVVVAFEDPNSKRAHVSLAMSRTWGHLFDRERPEASSLESPAERPVIALRDSLVMVGWRGPDRSLVTRVGILERK